MRAPLTAWRAYAAEPGRRSLDAVGAATAPRRMLRAEGGEGRCVVGFEVTGSRIQLGALGVLAAAVLLIPAATASHTPSPASVTIAGSLQSEAGCPATGIPAARPRTSPTTPATTSGRGRSRFPPAATSTRPRSTTPGTRTTACTPSSNGANIPLAAPGGPVKFYYDHKTHWATDNKSSVIAVAPGSFQSELGCPGDWDARLPALVARGSRRRRHLHLRDDRAAGRLVRGQGRDQRELGRELRRGRRAGRRQHPVLGSGRQHEGHVLVRRGDARARPSPSPRRRERRASRARSRTSTSRARTASAPRATRRRRSGSRSPAC